MSSTPSTSSDNPSSHVDSNAGDAKLGSGLKVRHLTMMGLGSTIGAGLFLGTGVGIEAAGPAVLLAYIVAGLIAILVMQMLGEMGTVILPPDRSPNMRNTASGAGLASLRVGFTG